MSWFVIGRLGLVGSELVRRPEIARRGGEFLPVVDASHANWALPRCEWAVGDHIQTRQKDLKGNVLALDPVAKVVDADAQKSGEFRLAPERPCRLLQGNRVSGLVIHVDGGATGVPFP